MQSARQLIDHAKTMIRPKWDEIEDIKLANQARVLAAFQEHHVSEYHFAGSTGYGYNDSGREAIEALYAQIFGGEAALVRPQLVSGTHAIATCLAALLEPGDELISLTGLPMTPCSKSSASRAICLKAWCGRVSRIKCRWTKAAGGTGREFSLPSAQQPKW